MILLVTYHLKGPAGSYAELFEQLKGQDSWWHYMPSTWLVATDLDANTLVDQLRPYLQAGDRMLIVPMRGGHQGLLPKKAWNWIKNHRDW